MCTKDAERLAALCAASVRSVGLRGSENRTSGLGSAPQHAVFSSDSFSLKSCQATTVRIG